MNLSREKQDALVSDACGRNLQVEVHRQRMSGDLVIFRGRCLVEKDGAIGLEMKRVDTDRDFLNAGNVVTVYIAKGEDVYSFMAEVLKVNERIALNAETQTNGIWIKRLGEVSFRQRRNAYRTQVAGSQDIAVSVHGRHKDFPDAAPIRARHFTGKLAEGSATGLGVVLSGDAHKHVSHGTTLYASFHPPEEEDPFVFLGEVRHRRTLHDGAHTRVGLKLIEWPDRARFGRMVSRFEKWVTEVERDRRRRMAS